MINLIKADLYKETRKKSLKLITILLIITCFLSIIILNKTYKQNNTNTEIYKLFTKEEYKNINKHGNYNLYKESYNEYKEVVNNIDKINVNNNKVINILNNKIYFLYFIGIVVIFISFNSLSYDYTNGTLKYIVLNKKGRTKLLLSKIISIQIISLLLIIIFSIFFLSFTLLKFHTNLLNYYKYIYIFNKFIKLPYLLYYFISNIIFIIPYTFLIIFTYLLTILFKGNTISLIISNITYLFSLVISQFLITSGIGIIEYTFLPYLDFTYHQDIIEQNVNNMIFNTNIKIETSIFFLIVYIIIGIVLSIKLFKRDIA